MRFDFQEVGASGILAAIKEHRSESVDVSVGSTIRLDRRVPSTSRQSRARAKLAMDRGDFRSAVQARVHEIYRTAYAREQVMRHFSAEANPLQRMADAVCVAYKVPPVRRLKGNKAGTKQILAAVKASRLDRVHRRAARAAFITGVSWVSIVPVDRDGLKPHASVITPDHVIRLWYGTDDRHPDALLMHFRPHPDEKLSDDIRFAFVDADGTRYLDDGGKLVDQRLHAMGMPTLAEFRVDEPDEVDPWDCNRNDKLFTATVDVARLIAHMRWVRKEQSRKLLVITGERADDIPEGQAQGPEMPVVLTSAPAELTVDVLDFDQSIANAEAEISALLERVAESYGLSSKVLNPSKSVMESHAGALRAEEHSALADLRYRQTLPLRDSDTRSVAILARACEVCGDPCPSPDRVASDLEVSYAELTFVDHPLVQIQVSEALIKLGFSDHIRELQKLRPHLTEDEAKEQLEENVENRNEMNQKLSEHQIHKDPSEAGEQLSARQGREGGQATPNPDNQE